jgi:hypothetical protein
VDTKAEEALANATFGHLKGEQSRPVPEALPAATDCRGLCVQLVVQVQSTTRTLCCTIGSTKYLHRKKCKTTCLHCRISQKTTLEREEVSKVSKNRSETGKGLNHAL